MNSNQLSSSRLKKFSSSDILLTSVVELSNYFYFNSRETKYIHRNQVCKQKQVIIETVIASHEKTTSTKQRECKTTLHNPWMIECFRDCHPSCWIRSKKLQKQISAVYSKQQQE